MTFVNGSDPRPLPRDLRPGRVLPRRPGDQLPPPRLPERIPQHVEEVAAHHRRLTSGGHVGHQAVDRRAGNLIQPGVADVAAHLRHSQRVGVVGGDRVDCPLVWQPLRLDEGPQCERPPFGRSRPDASRRLDAVRFGQCAASPARAVEHLRPLRQGAGYGIGERPPHQPAACLLHHACHQAALPRCFTLFRAFCIRHLGEQNA